MELLLHEAGVKDVRALQQMGAKTVWLLLRQKRKQISSNVIYSLEGAIQGVHAAALPALKRQELEEWVRNRTHKN
jgi:DNA transformation protein